MSLVEFTKALQPIMFHFSIILYFVHTLNLNRLEFLGLNFSVVFGTHFLVQSLKFLYNTWIGVWLGHNVDLKRMGSWTIVTGATDGIGLAFSKELARRGLNLVLMSRSVDRLEKLAKVLESEFGIETLIIDVDFSQNVEIYPRIEKLLSGMDIGTLINNVGMSYSTPEHFHSLPNPDNFISNMVNINVLSVAMMTKVVLPGMVERGRGVVVNVGSIVSVLPVPWFSLYCGSKSFVDKFTEDLADEYRGKGIHFQYLLPGYVTTKLSKIRKSSFWVPDPDEFVRLAVESIGLQERTALWIPHRMVAFAYFWGSIIQPKGARVIATRILRSFWLFAKKREMQRSAARKVLE
jgi:17beta-estradiol 17-dehydrogenase / very-long-chain 3-oxoacyl-CoA reductase